MTNIWTTCARPFPDVLYQELNGESVLLNLATESYFGLDAVGTRIWQLLVKDNHVAATIEPLLREFEVDEPRLRADVAKLITELESAKLISLEPCDA